MPARTPARHHTIRLLIAAPILALTLTGCSLVPTPDNIVEGLVDEAISQSGEDIDVDVDTSGDGVSMPEGWPDLPTPEGRVISAAKVADAYNVSIAVASEEAARAVIDDLTGAGFELMGETDYGELKGAMLRSDAWTVIYGWTVTGDEIVVSYTVSPTSA